MLLDATFNLIIKFAMKVSELSGNVLPLIIFYCNFLNKHYILLSFIHFKGKLTMFTDIKIDTKIYLVFSYVAI